MAVSIFDSKAVVPDDSMIADVLGESYPLWVELQNHVRDNFPNVTCEWKHYGKSSGWVLKLLSKKRNLLFLIPKSGCFRVRFGISEKAVTDVETADLPDVIKEAVRVATPYAEGRSIDLDISLNDAKVLAYVKDRQLVDIGTIVGNRIDAAKTMVQITNQI